MHTPDEIKAELEDSGYSNVELIAIEGIANALDTDELSRNQDIAPYLLEYLKKTESIPELLGVSGHIFAVARKN